LLLARETREELGRNLHAFAHNVTTKDKKSLRLCAANCAWLRRVSAR